MGKRRFELVLGTSSKFWEVEARGAAVAVRFGKIGTEGQTSEKKLASPAAAAQELEKLVREKTKKGYREVGAAKAEASAKTKTHAKTEPAKPAKSARPAKAAAPAKAGKPAAKPEATSSAPARSGAIMPVPGIDDPRPGRVAFTAELDALLERGWPHLRVLTDEVVPAKKAIQLATKALGEVDPFLPTIVPRDVARRVLVGLAKKRTSDPASAAAAIASDREVDDALLVEIVTGGAFARETYPFRLREATFLLEAFLGTERVAEVIAGWCQRALEQPKLWGDKYFVDHDNANFRRVTLALGWLRLRMPPERWRAITAPLAKRSPKLPKYSGTLARLLDEKAKLDVSEDVSYVIDVAAQRRDPAPMRARLAKFPAEWTEAEVVYTLGGDFLLEADVSGLPRLPKWRQERIVAEIGVFAAPGTARVIAALLPSRSAGAAARAWVELRRAWLERVALPVLEKRPADAAHVAAIRAVLGGERAPATATPEQLEAELRALIAGVPQALRACGGDPAKELAALRAAFARYCEIRAAQGDVTPEAYFTHRFADMDFTGIDRETHGRWIDLAIDAMD